MVISPSLVQIAEVPLGSDHLKIRLRDMELQGMQGLNITNAGLCSSRAQWPLVPNFCSQAIRKSYFFIQIICWAP